MKMYYINAVYGSAKYKRLMFNTLNNFYES